MLNKICNIARAVIIDQGQILLCKTLDLKQNFYFLPGGHIEHGETASKALLRELKEEVGAEFKIEKFLGCFEHIFHPQSLSLCHNHEYNFVFKVKNLTITVNDTPPRLEKHMELFWVNFNQIANIDLKPESFKELIIKWLQIDMNEAFKSYIPK